MKTGKGCGMSLGDYNLRNRHVSQQTMVNPKQTDTSGDINVPDMPENNSVPGTPKEKESESPKQQEQEQIEVIKMKDFTAVDSDEKLNLLMVAINKINTSFHHKFEELNVQLNEPTNGLVKRIMRCEDAIKDLKDMNENEETGLTPRIIDAETNISDIQTRMDTLEENNKMLVDQVHMLCGTVQVYDKRITANTTKVIDLTARSMSANIIIDGILEQKDETPEQCSDKVFQILSGIMKMDIEKEVDIVVAHRIGMTSPTRPRQMVVRCSQKLRSTVFKYTKC